jgi:hypothetical protein
MVTPPMTLPLRTLRLLLWSYAAKTVVLLGIWLAIPDFTSSLLHEAKAALESVKEAVPAHALGMGGRVKKTILPLLFGTAVLACSGGGKDAGDGPKGKDVGAQAADVASDTDALAAANAAAGEVVRAAGDCAAVKTALASAESALNEIEGSVRTAAGKTTFEAIRKRVKDIGEACP